MLEDILNLINQKKIMQAHDQLATLNVVDLAHALENLDEKDTIRVFRVLPKDQAADVFSYLSRDFQEQLIAYMTDRELSSILEDLFLDDTVDIIEEMPANVVKRLLMNTDAERRSLINSFLQYPKDSAGSLMTIEYVDLKKNMTVRDSFEHIRQTGFDKETVYTCYVTDASRKLIGVVSIKTLLLADPDQLLETVMDHHFISVQTLDDQEEIAHLFDRYDLLALPVVDHENRLVGIITVDDALDVIQEESTEDFEKMAAMLPSELPYLDTSIMSHIKQRLPWLLLLMFSATFSELIITYFEDAISVVAALVSFIPMLMDTGGNSGSQSATLVIRGMALGQIAPSDSLRVARKETQVALLVGLALATINMARVLMFNHSLTLALTVSLSLMATVLMSKLIGSLLPLLAKKLKVDPAIMAAPVITTLVDAGSLAIYFLTARAILHL